MAQRPGIFNPQMERVPPIFVGVGTGANRVLRSGGGALPRKELKLGQGIRKRGYFNFNCVEKVQVEVPESHEPYTVRFKSDSAIPIIKSADIKTSYKTEKSYPYA